MIALALLNVALADGAKILTVKVTGPGAVPVYESTLTLPVDAQEARVEVAGVPYAVSIITSNRHDTVAVEVVVYELKGKKEKRKEVSRPKLILYEDYPGHLVQPGTAPRGYADSAPFEWTLDAVWDLPEAE